MHARTAYRPRRTHATRSLLCMSGRGRAASGDTDVRLSRPVPPWRNDLIGASQVASALRPLGALPHLAPRAHASTVPCTPPGSLRMGCISLFGPDPTRRRPRRLLRRKTPPREPYGLRAPPWPARGRCIALPRPSGRPGCSKPPRPPRDRSAFPSLAGASALGPRAPRRRQGPCPAQFTARAGAFSRNGGGGPGMA